MNGPIAQIVALACHANSILRELPTNPFFPQNSTCRFCESVTFSHCAMWGWTQRLIANSPDEWFAHLQNSGAIGVRVFRRPQAAHGIRDRKLAGLVGGGGLWTMETQFSGGRTRHWTAEWQVWDQNAPEKKIWRVAYRGVHRPDESSLTRTDLTDVSSRLLAALQRIRSFADQFATRQFVPTFDRAIQALTSEGAPGYHQDLAPKNVVTPQAEMLLNACQHAWVFGGMGSWNDLTFGGIEQTAYDRVSENLYSAITEAIVAATNTSCISNSN